MSAVTFQPQPRKELFSISFQRFDFTKTWIDPVAFPTMETDEGQVRRDMQALHDESRNALNGLMDCLEGPAAAASIGMTDADGAKTTVQAELGKYIGFTPSTVLGGDHSTLPTSRAVSDAIARSGNLPSGGVAGQALIKASGGNFDVTWGQPGYSRAEILADDTAQRYGLDGDALPDTVFQRIRTALEDLDARAVAVAGSYQGAGVYGPSAPNMLTFERPPKLLLMTAVMKNDTGVFQGLYYGSSSDLNRTRTALCCAALTTDYAEGIGLGWSFNGELWAKRSQDGRTVFWYHAGNYGPEAQYNGQGNTYHYLAIL